MVSGGDLGTAVLTLKTESTGFESGIAGAFTKALGLEGELSKVALGAAGLGAGLAIVGGISIKMAGDFQQSTTELVTGAGESEDAIGMVRQGLLDMAGQVGKSATELSDGMYLIESAGFHGAAGLEVLRAAAEGAKVGNADMAVVADAVTSALNAYHKPAEDAVSVTNDLIATVAAGKMHMQDLAGSLGAILPVASALGVALPEVSGAIATMTMQGTNASTATTSLRFLISALAGPTKAAATELAALGVGESEIPGITQEVSDSLAAMGLHTSEVADTLAHGGLQAALTMITDAIGKQFPVGSAAYEAALKGAVGGTRGMTAALELTNSHAATFTDNVKNITAAAADASGEVKGWSLVQGDFNFQIDAARATLGALLIQLGMQLLPIATQVVSAFTNGFIPAVGTVIGLVRDALTPAISGLADKFGEIRHFFDLGLFGGQAGGDFGKLQEAAFDLGEEIRKLWDKAKPAFDGIGKAIDDFTGGNKTQLIQAIGIALGVMTSAVIITGMIALGTAIAGVAVSVIAATLPFIAITAAIALVALGVIELIKHWDDITARFPIVGAAAEVVRAQFNKLTDWITSTFIPKSQELADKFVAAGQAVVTWVTAHWDDIRRVIEPVMIAIEKIAQDSWTQIQQVFSSVMDIIKTLLISDWDIIKAVFETAFGVLEGMLDVFTGIFTGNWTLAWSGLKEIISAFFEGIKTVVSDAFWALEKLAGDFYDIGVSIVQGMINGVQHLAGGLIGAVAGAVHDAYNGVVSFIKPGSPSKLFTELGATIPQGLAAGINADAPLVVDAIGGMGQGLTNAWQDTKIQIEQLDDQINNALLVGNTNLADQLRVKQATLFTHEQGIVSALSDMGLKIGNVYGGIVDLVDKGTGSIVGSFSTLTAGVQSGLAPLPPYLMRLADTMKQWGTGVIAGMTATFQQALAISAAIAQQAATGGTAAILGGSTSASDLAAGSGLTNSASLAAVTAADSASSGMARGLYDAWGNVGALYTASGNTDQSLRDQLDQIQAALNNIGFEVGISGNLVTLGSEPFALASGGIAYKPTLAHIAESGPEAVIPLQQFWDKLQGFMTAKAGGDTVYGNKQNVYPNIRNTDAIFRNLDIAVNN